MIHQGDFRVAFRLCFKASPSATESFIWKLVLFTRKFWLNHLHVNKTNFHVKGFALGLALKQRRKATRKSPNLADVKRIPDGLFLVALNSVGSRVT